MQVAIYARVSTTRQAENDLSIPDQLRQMRQWCQRHGHVIVKEYIEPGASATDDKERGELMRACVRTWPSAPLRDFAPPNCSGSIGARLIWIAVTSPWRRVRPRPGNGA